MFVVKVWGIIAYSWKPPPKELYKIEIRFVKRNTESMLPPHHPAYALSRSCEFTAGEKRTPTLIPKLDPSSPSYSPPALFEILTMLSEAISYYILLQFFVIEL